MEAVRNEELSNEEVIKNFLNDKDQKEAALKLSHQLLESFPTWFSIPRLVKKFKIDNIEASRKIEILMLFKFCVGKVEKNIPYFKIDLDHKIQRELISQQIIEKEGEILFLKEKLSKLN